MGVEPPYGASDYLLHSVLFLAISVGSAILWSLCALSATGVVVGLPFVICQEFGFERAATVLASIWFISPFAGFAIGLVIGGGGYAEGGRVAAVILAILAAGAAFCWPVFSGRGAPFEWLCAGVVAMSAIVVAALGWFSETRLPSSREH
jgi:hypothetical protein